MSNLAVMPYDDYKAACDALREKTGKTDLIKSGDLASEIREIGGDSQFAKSLIEKTITELKSENLKGITKIGTRIFQYCNTMTSVDISDTDITRIEAYGISYCDNLKTIKLPKCLQTTAEQCFNSNKSLEYISVPDSVTQFSWGSLGGCVKLKTVNFGASYNSINNYLFSGCSGLTHLTIPPTVTYQGLGCYDGLKSLQYMDYISWTKVAPLNGNNFNSMEDNTTWKIIVPASLYDTWIKATNWAKFADHIVPDTIEGTSWAFDTSYDPTNLVPFSQNIYGVHDGFEFDRIEWDGNVLQFKYNPDTESEQQYDCYDYGWQCGETPIYFESLNGEPVCGAFLSFMYHTATKQMN